MFTFATPYALLGLLALPALFVIYRLMGRSRTVVVSSLFPWADAREVPVGGRRLERLQTPLLFFLELLILALIALAAAGPRMQLPGRRLPLAIVLDNSYSMLAQQRGESPRSRGLAFVDQLLDDSRYGPISLVLAGVEARPLERLEGRDWRGDWSCSDPAADLAGAISLAMDLLGEDGLVQIISDGAGPSLSKSGRVRLHAFGEPTPNLAIVNAVRGRGEQRRRCLIEIANFGPREQAVRPRIDSSDGALISIPASESQRYSFLAPLADQPTTVSLVADGLPIDDQAILLSDPSPVIRIALRCDNPDLDKLLRETLQALDGALISDRDPHLILTDGSISPEGSAWLWRFAGDSDGRTYRGPFVTASSHPLLEGMSLGGVLWRADNKAESGAFVPLITADTVPLLGELEEGDSRLFQFNFDQARSNLQQTPNWPILFQNLLDYRIAHQPGVSPRNGRLGQPIQIRTSGLGKVSVTGPDEPFELEAMRDLTLSLNTPGIYEIGSPELKAQVAINALSHTESDLRDRSSGTWGGWRESPTRASIWRDLRALPLLLAAALLVLHVWLWRRTQGGHA